MQIVVPMSGFGERFRRAGYTVPKPLIEVEGKPLVAHVIDLFPGETDFTFVCNQDHLDRADWSMAAVLRAHCPTARIVGIAPHKLGPIHAVRAVLSLLSPDAPVVVNYCDFSCYWDFDAFRAFVDACGCAGAIPAYRGFHPHSLGATNYAYLREDGGWVRDIREKQPFTDDRQREFASSGTYYFRTARLMGEAFDETIARGRQVGGEYYVSLAYKALLDRGLPVAVYPLQHFMQWGTPEDVAEYREWSDLFRAYVTPPVARATPSGSLIVPAAGLGQRFVDEGYAEPKPLIPVSGQPMIVQAVRDLPAAGRQVFVVRADMPGVDGLEHALSAAFERATIVRIPAVSQGQAHTAATGLDALARLSADRDDEPVTFCACDSGCVYDASAFDALLARADLDVLVWSARGHASAVRHPTMFGWIDAADDGRIRRMSVKRPLEDPARDPIVIGTFTFRRAADARRAIESLVARDARVNGEFYLDSCIDDAIAIGLNCHLFDVDHFVSWGTPDNLRAFDYWQSCFHKWPSHPYRLAADHHVDPDAVTALEARFAACEPAPPQRPPS